MATDNLAEAADQLSWWAEEATAAKTERDNWIREMRKRGGSLRAIADAAGLSRGAIQKIVAR